MGLRCLLGHDFDEPETERERNEEGNEVVVTVREVKTCQRCGEKQVVSENKEITSIDQLRESATGDAAPSEPAVDAEPTSGSPAEGGASTDSQWGTDELSTDETDSGGAAESEPPAGAGDDVEAADTETGTGSEQDLVDRGVADIIEQAEKDDDMLQSPSPPESMPPTGTEAESDDGDAVEADAETEVEDDVPVHPGQRTSDADDVAGADAESDDAVILDEEAASPPEEGRQQWEEEASPEEVPGRDPTVAEPSSPDGEDAEIIDGGNESTPDQPTAGQSGQGRSEPEQADAGVEEPQPGGEGVPSAVASEDAEIMDAGPEPTESADAEEPERHQSAEAATESRQPEPASTGREETDEGHMPWPDAPGEDEGHDATPPDGEPADVSFGGSLTPEESGTETSSAGQSGAEESGAEQSDAEAATAGGSAVEEPDSQRANGHREAESGDAASEARSTVDLEQSSRDAGMEYHCPECGLSRDVGNSSMRAGDICPECRKGYITEQQKAE